MSILATLGPVVNRLAAKELMDMGVLSNCHVDIMQLIDTVEFESFHEENNFLVTDSNHLDWLSEFVQGKALTGNTLVLVNRVETGKELNERIPDSKFIYGNVKSAERNDAYDEAADNDNLVIIASYGVAAVGINIPRIFNLVLVEPGKSFVRVIQSIGRGIRTAADKDFVQIYDIASTCKFSAKHVTARKKIYKEANYPFTVKKVDYLKELS
jgi:superfamily II DNA/RNA helicase